MATDDFFRNRLDQMIDLRHPLAVLAQWMPWSQIEAALAPSLAHKERAGAVVGEVDLFGPSAQLVGAGVSVAGRPRLSIRLMASLLYLKHALNLSDEELVERWTENVVSQFFSGHYLNLQRLLQSIGQFDSFWQRSRSSAPTTGDLFRCRVDPMIDRWHPLAVLARACRAS